MTLAKKSVKIAARGLFVLAAAFLSGMYLVPAAQVQAAPPRCYNHDGTRSATCQDIGTQLLDDRCYTELRSGPSGTLTGYTETSCDDPTDRDQDGNPGGSTGPISEPEYAPNDCNGPNIRAGAPEGDVNHCGILDYLVIFINALSAIVGLVVVGSIIYGGIQYSASSGDPSKTSAAKDRIRNSIIALLFFLFAYSILNWLVPGGVL